MDFLVLDITLIALLIILRKKNYSVLLMFGLIDFINNITYRLIKPNIALKKNWLDLQKQEIKDSVNKILDNYEACKKHTQFINHDDDHCRINTYSKSLE